MANLRFHAIALQRIGVGEKRIEKVLAPFRERQPIVGVLTSHSYLNDASKRAFQQHYNTRRNYLNQ